MPALPRFSRGLKLVRIAVYAMLLQLAVTIVMTVKAVAVDSPAELHHVLDWMRYLLLANGAMTFAMFIGAAGAIPELARFHMPKRSLVVSAIGFAIATAALAWSYHTLAAFIDVVLDPESSADEMMSRADDLKWMGKIAILKDLAYSVGLISLLGMVERSAQLNDQLSLRDEAGSMRRALMVMLLGDVFYQLTYGLGGGIGILGLVGSLLVGGYWIYCHVRLARFLHNAAYFMNEPHDLPVATVIRADKPAPRPSQPKVQAPRPSPVSAPKPSASQAATSAPPPVVVVAAPPPPAPTPMVAKAGESDPDDGPKFLR